MAGKSYSPVDTDDHKYLERVTFKKNLKEGNLIEPTVWKCK